MPVKGELGGTRSYTASTRSAKQICDQQGGYDDTVADICEVGMD